MKYDNLRNSILDVIAPVYLNYSNINEIVDETDKKIFLRSYLSDTNLPINEIIGILKGEEESNIIKEFNEKLNINLLDEGTYLNINKNYLMQDAYKCVREILCNYICDYPGKLISNLEGDFYDYFIDLIDEIIDEEYIESKYIYESTLDNNFKYANSYFNY